MAVEREFPVLMHYSERRTFTDCPASVPWSFVAPHEPQALRNHCGQSLEVLASRGGLSPTELRAVVTGYHLSHWTWPTDGVRGAVDWLKTALEAFNATATRQP